MAITGKKRSISLQVTKNIGGALAEGYPRSYSGLNSFRVNAGDLTFVDYPVITLEDLAVMPIADYQTRLADFIRYVQIQEPVLIIADVQTNEAYY